jgi:hypothetical protein
MFACSPASGKGLDDREKDLELDYGVATTSLRHFQKIPDLTVVPL